MLYSFIARLGAEQRAAGYVGRIIAACEGLATFPERGRRRDDILRGLRIIGFERRVTIAFTVEADAVVVEGVFYGGRDYENVLRGDADHDPPDESSH